MRISDMYHIIFIIGLIAIVVLCFIYCKWIVEAGYDMSLSKYKIDEKKNYDMGGVNIHPVQLKRGTKEQCDNYEFPMRLGIIADMESHNIRICNCEVGGRILPGRELYQRYKEFGIYAKNDVAIGDRVYDKNNGRFYLSYGTTEQCEKFIGKPGELVEDTGLQLIRLMDGKTPGGWILK